MANEINGTTCLVYRKNGESYDEIVGQMEMTNAVLGAPIEITTKLDNDFVTLINGELAGKGQSITGTIIYSNDAELETMRSLAQGGTSATFKLDFTGSDSDAVFFVGIPNGLSDSIPMGDKVSTSITILSLGIVSHGTAL